MPDPAPCCKAHVSRLLRARELVDGHIPDDLVDIAACTTCGRLLTLLGERAAAELRTATPEQLAAYEAWEERHDDG